MFPNASINTKDNLLDTSFELTNKGIVFATKIKIAFSLTPGSGSNNKEFMKKVGHMSSLPSSLMTLTLGQVLKSTKAIMDRVLQVVHLSNLNLIID